jgi:putative protein-disulfide isomerase
MPNQQPLTDTLIPPAQPADQINIIYYTDPLCCWSWAFEPQWRKFQYEFKDFLSIRYCMGGLIESWHTYSDDQNSVSRPIQMGPLWMQASHISGMPMHNRIWVDNAPESSYLACVAVKCALNQHVEFGIKYLRLLREYVMLKGLNIARESVLIQAASDLADTAGTRFDIIRFKDDLINGSGFKAFESDLQEVKYRNITRFPTLVLNNSKEEGLIITGYRPYEQLLSAVIRIAPSLKDMQQVIDAEQYKEYWGQLTIRELKEIDNGYK